MQTRVVILSGTSLFAEGIASRLRQHPDRIALEVMDSQKPEVIDHISSSRPSAVLVDANSLDPELMCLVTKLQLRQPDLKIVWLDSEKDRVQLMSSEQLHVAQVHDLLEMIEQ